MAEQAGDTPKRGKIGEEIYEQVEKLVSSEKLTRTQAFQRLSDETGRRAGTVAANYYRIARQRGAPLQKRGRRGQRRSTRATTDAGTALAKAQEALGELTEVVRRQDAEIATLRAQAEQLAELRRLVKKSL